MTEQVPLKGFDDGFSNRAWRDDVTLDAPLGEGSHVSRSFGHGSVRKIVDCQPRDMSHQQLIEATRIERITERLYIDIGTDIDISV